MPGDVIAAVHVRYQLGWCYPWAATRSRVRYQPDWCYPRPAARSASYTSRTGGRLRSWTPDALAAAPTLDNTTGAGIWSEPDAGEGAVGPSQPPPDVRATRGQGAIEQLCLPRHSPRRRALVGEHEQASDVTHVPAEPFAADRRGEAPLLISAALFTKD